LQREMHWNIIVQFIDGVKKHLNMVLILYVISADNWDFLVFLREQKEEEERVRLRVCEREKERNRETDRQTDRQTDWEI